MPTYLVESYSAGLRGRIDDVCRPARLAAERAAHVDDLRTTFLPDDEVVLHLFAARSADALREAVSSAGLEHERIVEAVEGAVTRGSGTEFAFADVGFDSYFIEPGGIYEVVLHNTHPEERSYNIRLSCASIQP